MVNYNKRCYSLFGIFSVSIIFIFRIENGADSNLTSSFFQDLVLLKAPTDVDPTPYRNIYKILDQLGYDTTKLMGEVFFKLSI